jgi:hypothetical protein
LENLLHWNLEDVPDAKATASEDEHFSFDGDLAGMELEDQYRSARVYPGKLKRKGGMIQSRPVRFAFKAGSPAADFYHVFSSWFWVEPKVENVFCVTGNPGRCSIAVC